MLTAYVAFLMLFVADLSQECGSVVLHASFDANPLQPAPSSQVNFLLLYVMWAAQDVVVSDFSRWKCNVVTDVPYLTGFNCICAHKIKVLVKKSQCI